jgi:tRNA threonylcarbamoyladenosine biosynthesis protein TsaB
MTILAIDTTGLPASAAVVNESRVIGEFSIQTPKKHAQNLIPMIEHLLSALEMDLSQMDLIGCAAGPGSFTGLRIGAATAKALSFAASLPIVPVPALDALAYNVFHTDVLIVPMMNARRSQVYAAFYQWENDGSLSRLTEYWADDVIDILHKAESYERKIILLGDGASAYQESIERAAIRRIVFAPPVVSRQRAACVGALGLHLAKSGQTVSADDFTLFYLRKPQAARV